MILPLSDAPNPRGVPWVTYGLIAANVAVYLFLTLPLSNRSPDPGDPLLRDYVLLLLQIAPPGVPLQSVLQQVSAYDLFVFQHGFRPAAPQFATLVTSLFLHGGFMHLFGNMLFLWIYGDNVEARLGRLPYLLAYVATGIGATLFYTLFALRSPLPLVGASGAISGVLGFYFLWFPRNTVRLFVFLFPFFMNVIEIPARIVLGIYLLIDNLLPFLVTQGNQGGGVAHGAHIGGFLVGLAVAAHLRRRDFQRTPPEYREQAQNAKPPGLPQAVRNALESQDPELAASIYFSLSSDQTRRLLRADESLELAAWLANQGHPEAALTLYRRHLRDFPAGPGTAAAHLGAGWIQLQTLGQPSPAYQHFLEALESDPSPAEFHQAREGLQQIRNSQKYRLGGR